MSSSDVTDVSVATSVDCNGVDARAVSLSISVMHASLVILPLRDWLRSRLVVFLSTSEYDGRFHCASVE